MTGGDKLAFNLPIEWRTHWCKSPFRLVDAATANWSTRRALLKYLTLPIAVAMFLGGNLAYLYFASGATSWLIAAAGTAVPAAIATIGHLTACWRFSEAKAWRRGEAINWLSSEINKLEAEKSKLEEKIKGLQAETKKYEKLLETDDDNVSKIDLVELLIIKTEAIDNLYGELRKLKKSLDERELKSAELRAKLDVPDDKKRRFVPIRQLGVDENGEGKGGMGSIYKIYDKNREEGDRVTVLKFIKPAMLQDPEIVGRFGTEATVLQTVSGTHFVQYIEHGELERAAYTDITGIPLLAGPPVPYIQMEYMTDPTLEEIINIERRIAPEKVLQIGLHLAQGLGFLHDGNVSHRDIKPANIFLNTEFSVPRLGDLGIVKKEEEARRTQTGAIIGSIPYMAPEGIIGKCKTHLDFVKADVHALGAVMFEMLTGKWPRGDEKMEQGALMVEIATKDAPDEIKVPEVTKEFAAVVLKAIASDPKERYQSMQEFYEALNEVIL